MSLLAGVNYYFISDDGLAEIAAIDAAALEEAGLEITTDELQALIADFQGGVKVEGNWYVGEDHINSKEYDFLETAGLLGFMPAMESSQLPGHA